MQVPRVQIAVVTGAASGIGAALATRLAGTGARLALCDVDIDRLQGLAVGLPGEHLLQELDVSDAEGMAGFAARVHDTLGAADLVVANAGMAFTGDALRSDLGAIQRIVEVHLMGVVHTNRAFAPAMVERRRGALVNVSSLFGLIGVPNQSAYCAAKAAIRGWTESLDQEMREHDVFVACVHPGAVATRIIENSTMGPTVQGMSRKRAARMIAAGIRPEEAAAIILHGVATGQRRILVGRDAYWIDKVQRLLPVGYRALAARLAKRLGS